MPVKKLNILCSYGLVMKLRTMIQRNKSMMLKSLDRSKPVEFQTIYLENTRYCNRSCSHCFVGSFDKTNDSEMDPNLIKNILDFSHKNNAFSVIFAGLEPLAKFDTTVAPYITDKKYQDMYFMIHTNGDFLNKEIADELDKANNTIIQLSLEGTCNEKHDASKGTGSYDKTIHAVELLKERSIPYGFFITCTSKNFKNVKETVNYAINLGATSLHIVGYKAIGPRANLDLMLSPQQEKERYRLKKDVKRDFPYLSLPSRGCNIGINKEGFFSYCPFLLQYTQSEQITPETSHNDMLKLFREHGQEFYKTLNDTIDCPLIENPRSVVEYAKQNTSPFNDMLKKDSHIYNRAVEIAEEFKRIQ